MHPGYLMPRTLAGVEEKPGDESRLGFLIEQWQKDTQLVVRQRVGCGLVDLGALHR